MPRYSSAKPEAPDVAAWSEADGGARAGGRAREPVIVNPSFELLCVRSCHALTILFFIGWAVLARFLPATLPSASAEQIVAIYQDNLTGIRVGCAFMMMSFGLWAVWGGVVAAWTRRIDETPILTYMQLVSLTLSAFIGILCAFFWSLAAYRPGEIDPDITLTLHDMAWLMFLLPWPPFAMWCLSIAAAILRDRSRDPFFPRWVAFFSMLTALLYIPACIPIFFKSGAFAYNGLLGMYVPLAIFFIWLEVVTHHMGRRLKREVIRQESLPSGNDGVEDVLPAHRERGVEHV